MKTTAIGDEDWDLLASFFPRNWKEMARQSGTLKGLRHLPKHDEESAKAWLYGKLFVAVLTEKLIHQARALSPWGYGLENSPATQPLA